LYPKKPEKSVELRLKCFNPPIESFYVKAIFFIRNYNDTECLFMDSNDIYYKYYKILLIIIKYKLKYKLYINIIFKYYIYIFYFLFLFFFFLKKIEKHLLVNLFFDINKGIDDSIKHEDLYKINKKLNRALIENNKVIIGVYLQIYGDEKC